MSSRLERVIIERKPDGRWSLVRSFGIFGDRWDCDDMDEAFAIVLAGFRPDGEDRKPFAKPPTAEARPRPDEPPRSR